MLEGLSRECSAGASMDLRDGTLTSPRKSQPSWVWSARPRARYDFWCVVTAGAVRRSDTIYVSIVSIILWICNDVYDNIVNNMKNLLMVRDVWGWFLCSVKGFGHFVRLLCVEYFGIYWLNTAGIPAKDRPGIPAKHRPGAYGGHLDVSLANLSALHWWHRPSIELIQGLHDCAHQGQCWPLNWRRDRASWKLLLRWKKIKKEVNSGTLTDGRAARVVH